MVVGSVRGWLPPAPVNGGLRRRRGRLHLSRPLARDKLVSLLAVQIVQRHQGFGVRIRMVDEVADGVGRVPVVGGGCHGDRLLVVGFNDSYHQYTIIVTLVKRKRRVTTN